MSHMTYQKLDAIFGKSDRGLSNAQDALGRVLYYGGREEIPGDYAFADEIYREIEMIRRRIRLHKLGRGRK
jgi:hypothetical protein